MSFYIEKIIIHNRAPFTHFELELENNNICLLSSYNGGGKTTILSHIVDSFYEMAKPHFVNEFENKENKYYRVSSDIFNLNHSEPSYFYVRFVYDDTETKEYIDYIDIRGKCTENGYNEAIRLSDKIPFANFSNWLNESNCVKQFSSNLTREKTIKIFSSNVLTSFPAYRFETPGYLNDIYKRTNNFDTKASFSGFLPNPIEVISDMDSLSNWMMDVLIDWQVNKNSKKVPISDNGYSIIDLTPEKLNIWDNLNKIFNLSINNNDKGSLRLGIGRRTNPGQRISIMRDSKSESVLKYPTIFNMSTGEMSTVSLFGEILHQCDVLHLNSLSSGVVLIDEIDNHLHIKIQKEVLPLLFKIFPNIQFIISSHSPFVEMGLGKILEKRLKIYSLIEHSGFPIAIKNDPLLDEVFDILIEENINYKKMYNSIAENSKKNNLLLVEDKYDQIYKIAFLKLKNIVFSKDNLEQVFTDCSPFEIINDLSASGIAGCLSVRNAQLFSEKTIVGLFDFDKEGSEKFYNLKDGFTSKNDINGDLSTGFYKIKQTAGDVKMYGLMLPVPSRLHPLISKSNSKDFWKGNGVFSNFVEIETLLGEYFLSSSSNYEKDTIFGIDFYVAKDKKKSILWEELIEQPQTIFEDFAPLFKKLYELFNLNPFTVVRTIDSKGDK